MFLVPTLLTVSQLRLLSDPPPPLLLPPPLQQQSADSHDVELSLALLEALLENQSPLVESHETSICSILWQLRSLPGHQRNPAIRGAMYAVVSLLARRVSPIYFLAIVSASLRQFIAASSASSEDGVEERSAPGQAFGLLAIGRGFMLLPGEIVEEELPRLRDVLVPVRLLRLLSSCPSLLLTFFFG